ncbi:PAS domain S-box protein [Wenzhouxiangella sp. XN201]|uniref:PAS domain-containing protein n=1 Tax=Wenzhouxiangella sp. XN201 TaxID=2710755 RepID=UPI0013CB3034|nr:PAS domain-containing protein [Wenzhouxiangella sp. XN201]NEZ05021.1 PAS domain S-box protein [Wenzhouxiangella sp. XN201]
MTTSKRNGPEHLRADAEGRLRSGTAPATAGWALEAETLSLLYRLASNPESSADALKLLHELQTHQVELDLQHAQLAENEHELALQLAHFQVLFDHAPAGYLVLGRDSRILRANRAASKVFGLEVGQLKDHMLTSLLSPESRCAALAALENAETGDETKVVQVEALDSRRLGLSTGMAPGEDAILALVFPEAPTQPG